VGYQQVLQVAPDGSWVLNDKRANSTQRGTMTEVQRQELYRLVGDPSFPREARQAPPAGTCNDGITYTIAVGELSSRFDQCGGTTDRPTSSKIVALALDATAM
jgi:hypothetical protein